MCVCVCVCVRMCVCFNERFSDRRVHLKIVGILDLGLVQVSVPFLQPSGC